MMWGICKKEWRWTEKQLKGVGVHWMSHFQNLFDFWWIKQRYDSLGFLIIFHLDDPFEDKSMDCCQWLVILSGTPQLLTSFIYHHWSSLDFSKAVFTVNNQRQLSLTKMCLMEYSARHIFLLPVLYICRYYWCMIG